MKGPHNIIKTTHNIVIPIAQLVIDDLLVILFVKAFTDQYKVSTKAKIKFNISKFAEKFPDKKNMRSNIFSGNPVCIANQPSQIRKLKKTKN